MTDKQPEVRSDIDKIYSAVIADSEALEDAKMTLEVIMKTDPGVYDEMINDTLSLIRKALSSSILSVVDRMIKVEIEMEPVAWCIVENGRVHGLVKSKPAVMNAEKWQPLYTAPPQREWQGLTDEEMEEAMKYWSDPCRSAYGGAEAADDEYVDMIGTWRYIEAKLKEKNT